MRIAFVHPDLGIGGAERLVVDAALGLQGLGHSVDLYTSYHDPQHCFDETRDGSLRVHHVVPPFPRSFKGKFHILFAHLRQLHLTVHLLSPGAPTYDVYFVDQLSTCVPFLRTFGHTRVVFYCHFPDKLLANAFVEGKRKTNFLKLLYRVPMDWLEEVTTNQADVILANSKFTAQVFKSYFPSISKNPSVIHPGINISAYEAKIEFSDLDVSSVASTYPTFLSLNRFEGKKNAMLALKAFAFIKNKHSNLRLVLAGGYDSRLEDNVETLCQLVDYARSIPLPYDIISPVPIPTTASHLVTGELEPHVLFILNFTTTQRTALLQSPTTLALLYTPANEHFGIVPVEAMACGLPVLACDSGGPTESVVSNPADEQTGWLKTPDPEVWAEVLLEIVTLPSSKREAMANRAKERARRLFGMDAMARGLEDALREAVSMGSLDGVGWVGTLGVMLFGFLLAYLAGPFIFAT